jgi:hypothetical protein
MGKVSGASIPILRPANQSWRELIVPLRRFPAITVAQMSRFAKIDPVHGNTSLSYLILAVPFEGPISGANSPDPAQDNQASDR